MKKLVLAAALALTSAASAAEAPFTATSTSLKNGEQLSMNQVASQGCAGHNLSPQVSWSNVPANAKSIAVTLYDPDARTGSGWWHWTVFNIPVSTTEITEGANPPLEATQGRTDAGTSRFAGACPPKGDPAHHYNLTVWAMPDANLGLNAMAPGAMVGHALYADAIASSTITGLYSR